MYPSFVQSRQLEQLEILLLELQRSLLELLHSLLLALPRV